jgi:hypothetical protein
MASNAAKEELKEEHGGALCLSEEAMQEAFAYRKAFELGEMSQDRRSVFVS